MAALRFRQTQSSRSVGATNCQLVCDLRHPDRRRTLRKPENRTRAEDWNIQTAPKDRFVEYGGSLDTATMHLRGSKLILVLGLEDCI
jgi:hypothetical protein